MPPAALLHFRVLVQLLTLTHAIAATDAYEAAKERHDEFLKHPPLDARVGRTLLASIVPPKPVTPRAAPNATPRATPRRQSARASGLPEGKFATLADLMAKWDSSAHGTGRVCKASFQKIVRGLKNRGEIQIPGSSTEVGDAVDGLFDMLLQTLSAEADAPAAAPAEAAPAVVAQVAAESVPDVTGVEADIGPFLAIAKVVDTLCEAINKIEESASGLRAAADQAKAEAIQKQEAMVEADEADEALEEAAEAEASRVAAETEAALAKERVLKAERANARLARIARNKEEMDKRVALRRSQTVEGQQNTPRRASITPRNIAPLTPREAGAGLQVFPWQSSMPRADGSSTPRTNGGSTTPRANGDSTPRVNGTSTPRAGGGVAAPAIGAAVASAPDTAAAEAPEAAAPAERDEMIGAEVAIIAVEEAMAAASVAGATPMANGEAVG